MYLRFLTSAALLALPKLACAAGLTIAVVAPQSGPYALLGQQVITGAKSQIEAAGNTMLAIDETCEDNAGEAIATKVIAGDAAAAIGFLCSQSLWGALPALAQTDIPAITLSVRSPILFEDAAKKQWPLFSLAPAPDAEEKAIADIIAKRWAKEPFAILDDGTIHARELAEHVRQRLEDVGVVPVFADAFRPALEKQTQVARRLEKANVSHVFISGDRNDIAIIARDAKAEQPDITVMGGEALLAAEDNVPLPSGVLAVFPEPWRDQPQASAVLGALSEQNVIVEGYILPAHAAAFIAAKASEQAKKEGKKPSEILRTQTFATAIGPVKFGNDQIRETSPYAVFEWQNGEFKPAERGETQ
ncbi:ABC transporter substrate-binding protein [Rhizobium sp. L1K21]|uniref:ABC transporter substrate-binding protein n=1 Tax=Rhizobium sp. L1K21 TaxID=2954933 RepID=UPI002091EE7F|nr:ABC transporter substrate-binding protein [Rhizobium sp. L1K21]MCO6185748.1 ABC transporter substrate-binding protein [Rhizobium sp. L1K21]